MCAVCAVADGCNNTTSSGVSNLRPEECRDTCSLLLVVFMCVYYIRHAALHTYTDLYTHLPYGEDFPVVKYTKAYRTTTHILMHPGVIIVVIRSTYFTYDICN